MIAIRVIHQIDVGGSVTGGVDSMIRNIISNAPPELDLSVVGLSSDIRTRPVGIWSRVDVGNRTVNFLPVGRAGEAMKRGLVPLTLRLMIGIIRYRKLIFTGADIFDFHRIEPILIPPRPGLGRAFNLFMHQDMEVVRSKSSDIKWKHLPSIYFKLEEIALRKVKSIQCVRKEAANRYRLAYGKYGTKVHFLRTWADEKIFFRRTSAQTAYARRTTRECFQIDDNEKIIIWVGRLDLQKDPILAIRTFFKVHQHLQDVRMIMVGDGVLANSIKELISELGLNDAIIMTGLLNAQQIADLLASSDLYFMSSAYEGMPISVIEAIAVGLPVVSTEVGEIHEIIENGLNGYTTRNNDDLGKLIIKVLAYDAERMRANLNRTAIKLDSTSIRNCLYEQYKELVSS